MASVMFLAGMAGGAMLLVLLALATAEPRLTIWPTPAPWSWQSLTFWSLFRIMNVAVIAVTVIDLLVVEAVTPLQLAALGVAGISLALYGLGLVSLGRENVYCGKGGLVTSGIYRWTRNPQYASIIPAYAGLAAAAQSLRGLLLAVLATAVFLTMASAEECWLHRVYGPEYERYRRLVPRFYSFRRFGRLCALRLARVWHRLVPQESGMLAPVRAGDRDPQAGRCEAGG